MAAMIQAAIPWAAAALAPAAGTGPDHLLVKRCAVDWPLRAAPTGPRKLTSDGKATGFPRQRHRGLHASVEAQEVGLRCRRKRSRRAPACASAASKRQARASHGRTRGRLGMPGWETARAPRRSAVARPRPAAHGRRRARAAAAARSTPRPPSTLFIQAVEPRPVDTMTPDDDCSFAPAADLQFVQCRRVRARTDEQVVHRAHPTGRPTASPGPWPRVWWAACPPPHRAGPRPGPAALNGSSNPSQRAGSGFSPIKRLAVQVLHGVGHQPVLAQRHHDVVCSEHEVGHKLRSTTW
jgi:hypothetical protein